LGATPSRGTFDSSDVVDTGDETAHANESAADANEGAAATNYELQVSNDESTWTTMTSIVGNTSGTENAPSDWSGAVDTTRLASVGRYVRVCGTVRCMTVSGYSIWEMQVYGDTNTNCVP
jgi:F5/8 type C domain